MGLRLAVANGNWSSPSTWNAGVLPAPGDTVASNGFTVTIDQNIDVDLLTNTVANPVSAVPLMTGDITPSGIVTFSGEFNSGYRAFQVFDRNIGTSWFTGPGTTITGWVAYQFTSLKNITAYVVNGDGGNYNAKNWTFEGWDGTSWIILDTVVNSPAGIITRSFVNPNTYIKYRLNITANNGGTAYTSVRDLSFYEGVDSTVASVAGGGFVLNSGVTVTCTNTGTGLNANGTNTFLTFSGSGSSVINGNLYMAAASSAAVRGFLHEGTGTITINGTVSGFTSTNNGGPPVLLSGTGILNINGTVGGGTKVIEVTSAGRLNVVGDVFCFGGNNTYTINVTGNNAIINITGTINNVAGAGSSGWSYITVFMQSVATLNHTGNVIGTQGYSSLHVSIRATSSCTINHTGNILGSLDGAASGGAAVNLTGNSYYNHIGSIIANRLVAAFQSTGSGAINILTGPFISSDTGILPIYVTRMHYRRTLGSYYEFRDNSTNGALPPAAGAPATRLVSPGTAIDSPSPANVRQGIVYASGSLTGTMVVPSPSNVANNVPVDNTVGTAVLDPNAIWSVPLTSINTLNSIGRRVKNAATVETTGAQLESLIRANE